MNNSNSNSRISLLEQTAFEHSEEDLFDILINNKELFSEFDKITLNELREKKNEFTNDSNKLLKILLKKLDIAQIIEELNKYEKYQINPLVEKYFPYEKPRKYQLETISKIYDAIEKGYKYIILEAVSGFGKSGIATTLSEIYSSGKTYLLNPTRQLSSQYDEEFEGHNLKIVYPRSDFACRQREKNSCAQSYCKGQKCEFNKNGTCNFLDNMKKSFNSNTSLLSYHLFLLENFYQSKFLNGKTLFTKRKLLILDEGHNIDNLVCSNIVLELYKAKLRDVGLDLETEARFLEEHEEYYYFLEKAKRLYEEKLSGYKPGSNKYNKYYPDYIKITKFLEYFKDDPQNIAFTYTKDTKLRFVPVTVNKIINDVLLDYGDVCIFMSSSIFNPKNFNYDLGIKEEETYVLKVPNIFKLSDNPIKICNDFDMGYDTLKETSKKTIPLIKKILKKHANDKGVIHTVSDECRDFIVDNIKNKRIITHRNTDDREEQLNKFKESDKPLVFVSPSMNEGVDLPGDQCRFQIIYKLPFISKTERVEKRQKTYDDGEDWYLYKMLTRLIQTYGRGIRYEGDYCKTYIIDNRIWEIIEEDLEKNHIIPQYFLDAIEDLNED